MEIHIIFNHFIHSLSNYRPSISNLFKNLPLMQLEIEGLYLRTFPIDIYILSSLGKGLVHTDPIAFIVVPGGFYGLVIELDLLTRLFYFVHAFLQFLVCLVRIVEGLMYFVLFFVDVSDFVVDLSKHLILEVFRDSTALF